MPKRYLITFKLSLVLLFVVHAVNALSPAQNERLVIGQLKRIYEAQAIYLKNYGAANFGTPTDLRASGLIDDVLVQGRKYGYIFSFARTMVTSTQPSRFVIQARPQAYRKTGVRSFYMSSTCLIAAADKGGGDAELTDPVIDECTPTIAHDLDTRVRIGMLVLHGAQATYQATVGNGNFGNQAQLVDAGFLMSPYGPTISQSYYHAWSVFPSGVSPQPTSYKAFATPFFYRETGIRSFYVDETGIVRGRDRQGMPANESDPPIESCVPCSPAANEATARFVSRVLWGSQQLYAFGQGPGPGNGNYGTLQQLAASAIFYVPFDGGAFEGYEHDLTLSPANPPVSPTFRFTLTPQVYGVTGFKSYYIDQTGVLRGADKNGAPADASDPPVLL